MVRHHDNLEYRVLQMIKDKGDGGILQSHLWKKINATSREGSRVSLKLERAGLINRKKELHGGKWTYRLIAKKRAITIDSITGLPCTFCLDQERCGVGSEISPTTCKRMIQWLDKIATNLTKTN